MALPIWITPSGSLGSYESSTILSIQLEAKPVRPATTITYTLAQGSSLPDGLNLDTNGIIYGEISETTRLTAFFIVKAQDNNNNYVHRSFTITVTLAPPKWITPEGSLGNFPCFIDIRQNVIAKPVLPATVVTYKLISGSLPDGFHLDNDGTIWGKSELKAINTISEFVIRATDDKQNIRDRTFSMDMIGIVNPTFITEAGELLVTFDSLWIELPISYSNPVDTNDIRIRITEGFLPPGLEINKNGLIRGYPKPPVTNITLGPIESTILSTSSSGKIVSDSTNNYILGREIIFSGPVMGGLVSGQTYYVKTVYDDGITFTVSNSVDGPTLFLDDGTGLMVANLPEISVERPTIRTYNFVLKLDSDLGSDIRSYFITVVNQNASQSQGGPGYPINTRYPTILNTRPMTFTLKDENSYYGYYVLPPVSSGYDTYPLTALAHIGTFQSDNYFSFKIIGYDFDGNVLNYIFSPLPLGLVGDVNTGWITGYPVLTDIGIYQFTFSAATYKKNDPNFKTTFINFSFNLANKIDGTIIWNSPSNLGSIYNGTVCTKKIIASSDVGLEFRIIDGQLPPNLTLASNGEIVGFVAQQPTDNYLFVGDISTFTFTIEAYSPEYPIINSEKTFTIDIKQISDQPTDVLYINAAPSIDDRYILNSLLTDDQLIPTDYIYRPYDIYFGKADDITYEHAYGIAASDIDEYLQAITENHYYRNITLGEIKTAVAKDSDGNILYEVVYSQIIDNLINKEGVSIASEIGWPRPIDLHLGPWYTSITDIYTSYSYVLGQKYHTSLTSGNAYILYPNSLINMRDRVAKTPSIGKNYDYRLLPSWMTSQQENGNTLGYVPAWVICYTKPGYVTDNHGNKVSYAKQIKYNIENNWKDDLGNNYILNQINFRLDRFSVFKGSTYNWDKNITPPVWTGLPSATPVPDPIDSKDFYVLFPRQTILPNNPQ